MIINTDTNPNKKIPIISKAVRLVIKEMPLGTEFHGWELKNKCVDFYPELKNVYVETCLRELRMWCKRNYRLVKRNESLYVREDW